MDSIERGLADAKLGASIDNAMQQLPEGYVVRIALSRGTRTVQLLRGKRSLCSFHGPLPQAIADAVEWAENEG